MADVETKTNTRSPRLFLRFGIALFVSYSPAFLILWDRGISAILGFAAAPIGVLFVRADLLPKKAMWLAIVTPFVTAFVLWAARRIMPMLIGATILFFVLSASFVLEVFVAFYGG